MKKSTYQTWLLVISIAMIILGVMVCGSGVTIATIVGFAGSSIASLDALNALPALTAFVGMGTTVIILYGVGVCIAGICEFIAAILGIKGQKSGKLSAFFVFTMISLVFTIAAFIFSLTFGMFDVTMLVSTAALILAIIFGLKVRDQFAQNPAGIPQAAPSKTASAINDALSDAADEMQKEANENK